MRKRASKSYLEKQAANLRSKWGFGSSEPIHLKSLLLKIGVVALFRPLTETFSGMAIRIEQDREVHRFMMVNSGMSLGHQHFTISHELYHLFVQENFESQVCSVGSFDKKDVEEYNADVFASYFLLPNDALKAHIPDEELNQGSVSLPTVLKLENMFSCSRRFLLIRLKEIGMVSEDQTNRFLNAIKATALSYGFGPYLYQPSECESVVGDYGSLAHKLLEEEKISESHFYSLMEAIGVELETVELTLDETTH